jgi:hypothetical protein
MSWHPLSNSELTYIPNDVPPQDEAAIRRMFKKGID